MTVLMDQIKNILNNMYINTQFQLFNCEPK